MAGNVDKGKVVLVGATTARVVPYGPETVSYDVVIPEPLRGQIEKNMPVIYVTFADRSGIILCRADGVGGTGGSGSAGSINTETIDLTGVDLHVRTLEADGEVRGAVIIGRGDVGTYQEPVIMCTDEDFAAAQAATAADYAAAGLTLISDDDAEDWDF